jgi:hypothetical protein
VKILCIALLLIASSASAAPSSEYAIRSTHTESGEEIAWYVSDARLSSTPEWKFDARTGVPLPMPAAYERANTWLKSSFPKIGSFRLRSYTVASSGNSLAPNRWYYVFDFVGDVDGSTVSNAKFSVMVLMDGTVVEPRAKK